MIENQNEGEDDVVGAHVLVPYLSEEVDLETGRPVALGLAVIQVIPHREYKLWARKHLMTTINTQTDCFTFIYPALGVYLQDLGQLLAALQLH